MDTAGSASSATHNSGPMGWQWKKTRIQQPDFEDDADPSTGVDEMPSKTMPTPKSQSKEISNQIAITTQFAIDIIEELTLLYADKQPAGCESAITFGQCLTGHVEKIMLRVSNLARDPWASGSVPYPPSPTAAAAIKDWFSRALPSTLSRKWVIHASPRLIHMDGSQLHEEIMGGKPLSHELCAVIMRRFGQIDSVLCRDAVGMRWRKFMEPDLATFAAADIDPSSIKSIYCQFKQDSLSYKVASCRMYFVPSIRPDGWCVYALDFLKKHITVLDPLAGSSGFSNKNIKVHERASSKILDSLLKCAKEFYSNWPHVPERWSRSFPMITEDTFTSAESGVCSTFLAKFFDGERLVKPMNKESIELHRQILMYDVMRLTDNVTQLPADVLEFIKTSFQLL